MNHDHNLFILVDDGTRGRYGGEIDFRAAFEQAASQDANAPVVTIVIQGGPNTLKQAHESGAFGSSLLLPNIYLTLLAVCKCLPVVVIDGSGKAADLLAYAYHYIHSPL